MTLRFTGTLTPAKISIVNSSYSVMKNGQIARISFFKKNCAIIIKTTAKVSVFYTAAPSDLTVLADSASG